MRLRIGVHLRDVIEKHDGTVYGDGVNIAHPVRTYRLGMAEGVGEPPAREAPTKAPAPPPRRPSIAVLPFDHMSGDPEQGYFGDGMTEAIITSLSTVPNLFAYRRRDLDEAEPAASPSSAGNRTYGCGGSCPAGRNFGADAPAGPR